MPQISAHMDWEQMNPILAQNLNPVLVNPLVQGRAINNIKLLASVPMILNHGLGRQMQGVIITPFGNAVVWVSQPFNDKTVTITASADVVVNLWGY